VREIAAHAGAVGEGVDRRGAGIAGAAQVVDAVVDPVADRGNPVVARRQSAKFAEGETSEFIGQAVARGIEEGEHLQRHLAHRDFRDLGRVFVHCREFDFAFVADCMLAFRQQQPEVSIAGIGGDMGLRAGVR
jgi:hypothetical protein